MILVLILFSGLMVWADENIRPKGELEQQGYLPKVYESARRPLATNLSDRVKHSLLWPVPFLDEGRTIANAMAQFQPFGSPYIHGGCDLRTQPGAPITSPVRGALEAGHYGYEQNDDGSLTKFWRPWPQDGDATYFELAVVTPDGLRFEFHHVDRSSLPEGIVLRLNRGNARVEAGEVMGFVLRWPGFNSYDHLHYNVILADGTRLNPEHLSAPLLDTLPPEILGLFGVFNEGAVVDGLQFETTPAEIVVHTQDKKNGNPYSQPPVRVLFKGTEGSVGWDFSEALRGPDGGFPAIWSLFRESLRTPNGRRLRTEGGYGMGASLIRVPVPKNYAGDFQLILEDIAGNQAVRLGKIGR
jgi:hypothetical protein